MEDTSERRGEEFKEKTMRSVPNVNDKHLLINMSIITQEYHLMRKEVNGNS